MLFQRVGFNPSSNNPSSQVQPWEDTGTVSVLHKTSIIGIAGGSASGKSTFAEALRQALSKVSPVRTVEVFHTDSYFTHDKERGPVIVSASAGEVQFDCNHPDSADNARLLSDLNARTSGPDAPEIVILEGLMVLHRDDLREILDLRLFIELDADVRALRRLLRSMKNGQEPPGIIAYYQECARVGHARYVEPSRAHADFVLRGDADFARLAPLVASMAEKAVEGT